jgi:hypothetical protein
LGLGVTPSAWTTSYGIKGFNISNGAVYGATNDMNVLFNSYFNGTNFIYSTTAVATKYTQGPNAQHQWFTAPSGTAGNAITFTQAMTLEGTDRTNLIIGATSSGDSAAGRGVIHLNGASTAIVSLYTGGTRRGYLYTQGTDIIATAESGQFGIQTTTAQPITFTTNNAEAMRINSSGYVFINRTTDIGNGILQISGVVDSRVAIQTYQNATTAQGAIWFNNPNGNVGSITTSGSVTSYNVTSDQRLKENIQDADSASALIDSLQVRQFDWKTDNTHQRYGFVAQELVTVAPEAVHQPVNEDDMMAVDYSKLVPMLVKEIQSLRKRLTALEST